MCVASRSLQYKPSSLTSIVPPLPSQFLPLPRRRLLLQRLGIPTSLIPMATQVAEESREQNIQKQNNIEFTVTTCRAHKQSNNAPQSAFLPSPVLSASTCSPWAGPSSAPNAPLSTKTIRILDHQVQPAGPLSTTSSSPSAAAAADRRETDVGVNEGEGDRRPRERSRARARTRCTSCALGDADRSRTGRVGVLCSNECMNVWKGPSYESTIGDVTDDGGDEVRGGVKEPGCDVCLVSS